MGALPFSKYLAVNMPRGCDGRASARERGLGVPSPMRDVEQSCHACQVVQPLSPRPRGQTAQAISTVPIIKLEQNFNMHPMQYLPLPIRLRQPGAVAMRQARQPHTLPPFSIKTRRGWAMSVKKIMERQGPLAGPKMVPAHMHGNFVPPTDSPSSLSVARRRPLYDGCPKRHPLIFCTLNKIRLPLESVGVSRPECWPLSQSTLIKAQHFQNLLPLSLSPLNRPSIHNTLFSFQDSGGLIASP